MKHKGLRVRKGSMPSTVNGKVPPRRLSNAERRPREYLTPDEVELLITTAQKRIGARTPHRDATMILLAYRHGLRASELCSLRWDMLDLSQGFCQVSRHRPWLRRTGLAIWPAFTAGGTGMRCIECGSTSAATERPERTAQGYRRFRCRACGKQFNERTGGLLNR